MKKIRLRKDLKSKTEYAKDTGIQRKTIDKMINEGQLAVEEISGKHYIIIK